MIYAIDFAAKKVKLVKVGVEFRGYRKTLGDKTKVGRREREHVIGHLIHLFLPNPMTATYLFYIFFVYRKHLK